MIFENRSELATHLSRITRDLADHVALEFDVITGTVNRHAHAATRALRRDDPRQAHVAGVTCRHYLTGSSLTDAPLGGACGVDYSFELIATRESGRSTNESTLR